MSTKANLLMEQGTTFSIDITLQDTNGEALDVTGFTARSQMRKHLLAANGVSLVCNLTTGNLNLSLPASNTVNIEARRWVYDVELVNGSGVVSRPLEGIIQVKGEATKT